MKCLKIMIPNLRFFASERFIFMVRVSLSKTHVLNRLTLLLSRNGRTERFIFMVRVSMTHDRFQIFVLARNGPTERFIFMVRVSITHDCIYHLITHRAIQRNKKYINCTPYILSHHGTNTNLSIKYLLKQLILDNQNCHRLKCQYHYDEYVIDFIRIIGLLLSS